MINKVRTIDFLPEIFRTETNDQFLSSTLDVLTSQPDMSRTQGFVGQRWGYGVVGSDKYIVEPSLDRRDYQLDPSVIFLKENTGNAEDFIDYPGMIQALKNRGAPVADHNDLFSNQFYSWDSFTTLDATVNFKSYWWIPLGPDAITVPGDINIATDILGKLAYTANMGPVLDPMLFVNGLKIVFSGQVTPAQYRDSVYYVEGVGSGIELVPVDRLTCTELTAGEMYIPWDSDPWDISVWSEQLGVPIYPDYIVMCRNSSDYNAWSRGNRWFHQSVLDTTTKYLGQAVRNPLNQPQRAQRPIIQFYPNLNLYNSGTTSSGTVDYIDNYTRDALSTISGAAVPKITRWYGNAVATDANGNITVTSVDGLSVNQEIEFLDVPGSTSASFGGLSKGVAYYINTLDASNRKITLRTVAGVAVPTIAATGSLAVTQSEIIQINNTVIIFAGDSDIAVRGSVWNLSFEPIGTGGSIVNVLAKESGVTVTIGSQSNIRWGIGDYLGTTWRWNGTAWIKCQTKTNLNQPPLFDVYNAAGQSFGDSLIYPGTTFAGCTLFRYKPATGTNDPVLGFPIAYSSVSDLGDILFAITYNSDEWTYLSNGTLTTSLVSAGYVYQRTATTPKKLIGWVPAAAPSRQYQVFIPDIIEADQIALTFPVPALPETQTIWQPVQVYREGEYLDTSLYTVNVDIVAGTTQIVFNTLLLVGESVSVLILSDETSSAASWTIPTNLQNNPFNEQLTQVAEGDIRNHWNTVFTNIPGAQGQIQGNNNLGNLPDTTAYGTAIIQSSATLILPGVFLRKPDLDLQAALQYNSDEYQDYKNTIIDLAYSGEYSIYNTPQQILDDIIYRIGSTKSPDESFFWSDMLPSGAPLQTKTYSFGATVVGTVIPLTRVYNFSSANYWGLSLYKTRTINSREITTQLIRGVDYTTSTVEPNLTIISPVEAGSTITVNEYNQTWGSYCPNTPTKLGLYPATQPRVELNTTYTSPQHFIIGHDGSQTKLWGTYVDERLSDFRDIVTLEFETRIYNNLKVSGATPIVAPDLIPGAWREGHYSWNQVLDTYSRYYLSWCGKNRIDYRTQYYLKSNQFTYNYNQASEIVSGEELKQGYWRGIYRWFYDTDNPATEPWRLIGYTDQPSWWTSRYGSAPYTSGNTLLWEDLAEGIDWNGGVSRVNPLYVRNGGTPTATIRGSIAGTTLTVTAELSGTLTAGSYLYGSGIISGTKVISLNWRSGGISEWVVDRSQTIVNAVLTVRPKLSLLAVLPVDSNGNLVSPMVNIVDNYISTTFKRSWVAGDGSPQESAYLKSSQWPFDLMKLLSAYMPAKFYNFNVDRDLYKYNREFNQWLYNERYHLDPRILEVYGSGTPKHSYINWVVDWINQTGADGQSTVTTILRNIDVRLTYRLAGFSDKEYLKFLTENSTPSATASTLLIPDDNWQLMLYDDVPSDRLMYTSVIVQRTPDGWTVWGNSSTDAYFTTVTPSSGPLNRITVGNVSVEVSSEWDPLDEQIVAYGTEFYTMQGLSEFLLNFGRYLEVKGLIYDTVKNNLPINWVSMISEYLAWAQQGWEVGSTISLNPSALEFAVEQPNLVVQPLTLQQRNFVLNQNLIPLEDKAIAVVRNGNQFRVRILTEGDTVAYTNLNFSAVEHAIVFDNTTIFGDIVYNTGTGLRMSRLLMQGSKTANWRGWVDANGFILNTGDIAEWQPGVQWAKGNIVLYKSEYWVAQELIEPSEIFNYNQWTAINYDRIKAGLLPNPSTIAYESTLLYDRNQANLDQQEDLLAFALIGFQPRPYMAAAELSDITQVNLYTNLIRGKGTNRAARALIGATTKAGELDYSIRENWAIKRGDFGAILNNNAVEFLLNDNDLTSNPAVIGFTDGVENISGVNQTVTPDDWINWVKEPTSANILPLSTIPYNQLGGMPSAGYVNVDDTRYRGFTLDDLNLTADSIYGLYRGTVAWLAKFDGDWRVFTPISIGVVLVEVTNNLNGTITASWNGPHGLQQYDPLLIVAFNNAIDGYYTVTEVLSDNSIMINNNLSPSVLKLSGNGVGMKLRSVRVGQASDLALPQNILPYAQFTTRLSWADENTDGSWTVWAAGPSYTENTSEMYPSPTWGKAVAYNSSIGRVISDEDSGVGRIWRNDALMTPVAPNTTVVEQLTSTASPTTTTSGWSGTIGGAVLTYTGVTLPAGVIIGNFLTDNTPGTPVFQTGTKIIEVDYVNYQVKLNLTLLRDVIPGDGTTVSIRPQGGLGTYTVAPAQLVASSTLNGYNFPVSSSFTGSIGGGSTPSTVMTVTAVASGTITPNTGITGSPLVAGTGATQLIARGTTLFSSDPAGGRVFVYDCSEQNEVIKQTITVVNTGQIAVSDDLYWLYVANTATNTIRVYHLRTSGYTLVQTFTGPAGVSWGASITTSNDGSKLYVGAPGVTVGGITNAGAIYLYARGSQSFIQVTPGNTMFTLWDTPPTVSGQDISVWVNNVLRGSATYIIAGATLQFLTAPADGSIVRVDWGGLYLQQQTVSDAPLQGSALGTSVTTNRWGAEVFAGAPYDRRTVDGTPNIEGAVYRWTNSGQRWGIVTATIANSNITTGTLTINGFRVDYDCATSIPALVTLGLDTPRNRVAYQINNAIDSTINIPGIAEIAYEATTTLNIVPTAGSQPIPGDKVDLTGTTTAALSNIAITPYSNTQVITDLNRSTNGRFGYGVLMNQDTVRDSVIISAPYVNELAETLWDYTDDLQANDTVFDSGATIWVDSFVNTGMVYLYDYLPSSSETALNPGLYAFGQYLNSTASLTYRETGWQSQWGSALAYADGGALISTPSWSSTYARAVLFTTTQYTSSWRVYREPLPSVEIDALSGVSIYNTINNETLENLDYIDPLAGKYLSPIATNIDWISSVDPATYIEGTAWGPRQVGKIWLNTDGIRLMNYHQPDPQYNAKWWGRAFPGSLVDLYTWVQSPVEPVNYRGPGFVVNFNAYTVGVVLDRSSNTLVPYYYFWVKNYPLVPTGKTLSPIALARYILDPQSSGIPFLAPITSNIIALYNSTGAITTEGSALHLGYGTGQTSERGHEDWLLIQTDNSDSFLPGVPRRTGDNPADLYLKYLNSFMGFDLLGQPVPDPNIPILVRTGTGNNPRQSMFVNRSLALQNYIQRANRILQTIPVLEYKGTFFLNKTGTLNGVPYDTRNWWQVIDWWAPGWNSDVKVVIEVEYYSELLTIGTVDVLNSTSTGIILGLTEGMIARVSRGSNGWEVYVWGASTGWVRIGAQNTTIEILSTLWTTEPPPAMPIYWIVRWLTEEVYTGELAGENNSSLITMFNFIQSNSYSDQNYLPWLNKTSLVDVQNTVGRLLPYKKFQRQNIDFVSGYLNEIKPFHVYIKEFAFTYRGDEVWGGDPTDFDLPAQYNRSTGTFLSPIMVYGNASISAGVHNPDSVVWRDREYVNWFNNYGLVYSNSSAPIIPVTVINGDLGVGDLVITVDNVDVVPWSGTAQLGAELVTWRGLDRLHSTLLNCTRGARGSQAGSHPSGTPFLLYTTPVMVMNPARGYTVPPTITPVFPADQYSTATVIYPREAAEFTAIIQNGSVVDVVVENAGNGYPVLPAATISPSSISSVVIASQVDTVLNQITIRGHEFVTGDSVVATDVSNSGSGLVNGNYYWVGVVDANTIALYRNYIDAINCQTEVEPQVEFSANFPPSPAAQITTTAQLTYPLGYSPNIPLFQTGEMVKVRFNSTINPIVYSDTFTYYWIRVLDPTDDPTGTPNNSIFDTVAFYNSYTDSITDVNRVVITEINGGGNLVSNRVGLIDGISRTDSGRVELVAQTNVTISVSALLLAYTDNNLVRGITVNLNFDRVSYTADGQPWSAAVSYQVGDLALYQDRLYRCVNATSGAWNLANWIEVDPADSDLTAADRVVGFYRPGNTLPGFTTTDLSQLMTGTTYPHRVITDPEFSWGNSFMFLSDDVDTANNTVKLSDPQPLVSTYNEAIVGVWGGNGVVANTLSLTSLPAITQTFQSNSRILVSDVSQLAANMAVQFGGETINSNVAADTTYWIYDVDAPTSTIRITTRKATLANVVAQSNAVGYMTVYKWQAALANSVSANAVNLVDWDMTTITTGGNAPVRFTGASAIGNIVIDQYYFVNAVVGNTITLTNINTDAPVTLTSAPGTMSAVFEPWAYATATTAGANLVTLSTLSTPYGNLTTGSRVRFVGTVFGGVVQNTDYWINTVNTGNSTVELSDSPGGNTVSLSTQAGNMTAVFTTYTQRANSIYGDGDMVRIITLTPSQSSSQYYWIHNVTTTPNAVTLHLNSEDSLTGANPVPITPGMIGQLAKPQSMLSLGGNISANVGSIFPVRYETNGQTPGFGLTQWGTYWATVVSTSTVALYNNRPDAVEDMRRVPLLTGVIGQLTVPQPVLIGNTVVGYRDIDSILINDGGNTAWEMTGNPFEDGYGPEELVPGISVDGVNFTVTTRPGSTWDPFTVVDGISAYSTYLNGARQISSIPQRYSHSGLNRVIVTGVIATVTTEDGITVANSLSWWDQVGSPVTIEVLLGLGSDQRKIAPQFYTVDWINQYITITPANLAAINGQYGTSYSSTTQVAVVVYEYGNGSQLARNDTRLTPFRRIQTGPATYRSEIHLGVPYEMIEQPDQFNFWLTTTVFVNGQKLDYNNPNQLFYNSAEPLYTLEPVRRYDPVNDPYNPAKIVFNRDWNLVDGNYCAWAVTSNVIGYYPVDADSGGNPIAVYRAPITMPIRPTPTTPGSYFYESNLVKVYLNGVLQTRPTNYTLTPAGDTLIDGFITVTFAGNLVQIGDIVKIVYGSGGISAPTTQWLSPTVTGTNTFTLEHFLGDTNYAPLVDLIVLGINGAATFANTFACRTEVPLVENDQIYVTGDNTLGIFNPSDYAYNSVTNPVPYTFYLKNVGYNDGTQQWTFQLTRFAGAPTSQVVPLLVAGPTTGLTFSLVDNLVVEVNGVRYTGLSSTEINHEVTDIYETYLSYPAPVFSLTKFEPNFLVVSINGVVQPYGSAGVWRVNFDSDTDAFSGFDADWESPSSTLSPPVGFFDDGTPFDNQNSLNVVFRPGVLVSGDIITIEYVVTGVPWTSGDTYNPGDIVSEDGVLYECIQANTASAGNQPPNAAFWVTVPAVIPVYSVVVNQDIGATANIDEAAIGGTMTLRIPDLQPSDIVSVTSWGRTGQQSLEFQGMTDITVARITGITPGTPSITPPLVSTGIYPHNLFSGDQVMINGNATGTLDGTDRSYWVNVVDDYTVGLYSDQALTIPVIYTGSFNLFRQSYIQCVYRVSSIGTENPICATVINQPLFNLNNVDRLLVNYNENANNRIGGVIRYWIDREYLRIVSITDDDGDTQNVLLILQPIEAEAVIGVTSMIPSATPGENRLRINALWDPVTGVPVVPYEFRVNPNRSIYYTEIYRENPYTQTWVKSVEYGPEIILINGQVRNLIESITVDNPRALVTIQTYSGLIAQPIPGATDKYQTVINSVNAGEIAGITITNSVGNPVVDFYWVSVTGGSIKIIYITDPDPSSPTKALTVEIALSNEIMIGGELIQYGSIDFDITRSTYGRIGKLKHSRNTTFVADVQPYDIVQGVMSVNRMESGLYDVGWYSNIFKSQVDTVNNVTGTYTFTGGSWTQWGDVTANSLISFANAAIGLSGLVVDGASSTGVLNFRVGAYDSATYTLENPVASGNGTMYIDTVTGITVGMSVISSDYPAAFVGSTVTSIDVPNSAIVVSPASTYGIPGGSSIQVATALPTLYPNVKLISTGEFIGITTGGQPITYTAPGSLATANVYRVLTSEANTANVNQWTITVAEPITVPNASVVTANITNFTVANVTSNNITNTTTVTINPLTLANVGVIGGGFPNVTVDAITTVVYPTMDMPLQIDTSYAANFLKREIS